MSAPRVSIVVIGRNEGPRLARALTAAVRSAEALPSETEIVYVDSASTDDSLSIAGRFSRVQIVELGQGELSAARARNAGIAVATGRYVQLVDGDMELDARWLPVAMAYTDANHVAAVAGSLMERDLQQSPWTCAFGQDWSRPSGPTDSLGGAALWRRDVLQELQGFDESLRLGEDPDLARRARAAGHRLAALALPMASHDLALHSFGAYWRRALAVGESRANIAARHPSVGRALRLPLAVAAVLGLALAAPAVAGVTALCGVLALIARRALLDTAAGTRPTDALIHAVHVYAVRFPVALGFLRRRLALRSAR